LVWSDAKIAKLTREFVTVADEAYTLYPENPAHIQWLKDKPAHEFFKKYGEAMPDGDWNVKGTKQGLYMIGPDGEYLEGKFAANGLPDDILQRMERALERWQKLRREQRYANKPVPKVVSTLPPEVAGKEFVLRVHSRDLPRGEGEQCGLRFDPALHADKGWLEFIKWAWNENWLAVDNWQVLVPEGKLEQAVDEGFVMLLAQQMLIDNVRGQAGTWRKEAVKTATMTMQGERRAGSTKITYRGEVVLEDGERSMRLKLYGEGHYDHRRRDLESLQIAAFGQRTGAHSANQRAQDLGPAPIGFAITRYQAPKGAAGSKAKD